MNGFDTIVLYEVCDINAHRAAETAINAFLENGGKVMIFDADRCSDNVAVNGAADYSGFLFPFTTDSPGPGGSGGSYGFIEPSTLTNLVTAPGVGEDALADANTFTRNAGGWCSSITATNSRGNTGNVEAYARTTNGGLAIYDGEDFWRTTGPSGHLKQVFDNGLAQAFHPDGLPCTNPATGIKLDPPTATDPVGTSQVETATVVDSSGKPRAGIAVSFSVLSGPDAGQTGSAVTNAAGEAQFTVSNNTGPSPDPDIVQASFTDTITHSSNKTTIVWTARATALTYLGQTSGDFDDPAILTARLTDANNGTPIPNQQISLKLGSAFPCVATTDSAGFGQCTVTPVDAAITVTISVTFGGNGAALLPSSTSTAFTVTHEETTLFYAGETQIANGTVAGLSGVLREDGITSIVNRPVVFTLGSGTTAQTCVGVTDALGLAGCTIASVNQPLNTDGTVGITAVFGGDAFYQPASTSAFARLEFLTGRAFGFSATIDLPSLSRRVAPVPDTGTVRSADSGSLTVPCAAHGGALAAINADTLCANVTTALAPGTSTVTATLDHISIAIPELPVILATTVKATSSTTCAATSGTTTITNLTIGGQQVNTNVGPGTTIAIGGGSAQLVVDEQSPVTSADNGLTVNALHLTGLDGALDVVVGSATSEIFNCPNTFTARRSVR
ncbi:MAG TPA: Ig-like domain-containing protein [Pseudonocardiaceae bacterium]|nr:Ig-like domain-containing protein [Pseudonocardiaceae bacterium]